ncbi:MAG: energy transducer TonB [Pyrinomonadaceae bacterium]
MRVQILIGEDGKVMSAQAIDGSPLLQFAARSAACDSKFSPTTLQGDPVKVSGVIVYNFVP